MLEPQIDSANGAGRDFAAEYRAAVTQESQERDFAFLNLPRDVCGIPVAQMTLRHLLVRFMIGCPFFEGSNSIPEAADVANFLWHLSPRFVPVKPGAIEPTNFWRRVLLRILPRLNPRAAFVCKIIFPNGPTDGRVGELAKGIKEHLEWTFYDAPVTGEGASRISFTSFAATYSDILASEYDWAAISDRPILDTPLVIIYQLFKALQKRLNPKVCLFNSKSDKIRADYYAYKNRNVPPAPPVAPSTINNGQSGSDQPSTSANG